MLYNTYYGIGQMDKELEKAVKLASGEAIALVKRGLLPKDLVEARTIVAARVRAKGKRKGWSESKIQRRIRIRWRVRRLSAKIPQALKLGFNAAGKDSKLLNLVSHYTKDL